MIAGKGCWNLPSVGKFRLPILRQLPDLTNSSFRMSLLGTTPTAAAHACQICWKKKRKKAKVKRKGLVFDVELFRIQCVGDEREPRVLSDSPTRSSKNVDKGPWRQLAWKRWPVEFYRKLHRKLHRISWNCQLLQSSSGKKLKRLVETGWFMRGTTSIIPPSWWTLAQLSLQANQPQ